MQLSPSINSRSAAAGWIDVAIEVLVGALLVAMPFALGVIAPWSEALVVVAVAAIAILLTARAWLAPDVPGHALWRRPKPGAMGKRTRLPVEPPGNRQQHGQASTLAHGTQTGIPTEPNHTPQDRQSLAWALTPAMLFIVIAAAQLLPLPASLVGMVSPHTLAIRSHLLGDLPGAAGLLSRATLSLYPAATAHDLRLVLVCAVVFLAAAQVLRKEGQYIRVLWAITLSGGAAAVLSLLQDLSGSGKIYWLLDSGHDIATGGPFVSYSNYSQYINLCTGAAVGLLLYTLRRDDILKTDGTRASRRPHAGWQVRELLSWRALVLLAVGALGFVTLCLSMSRGGMLALLCAIGLTLLMLARRRGMRGAAWVLALAALVAFVGLLYFGFDSVCDRMASLKNNRDPSAGRIQTFKDILVEWRRFPLLGTGLGTHEYVYPMFDRSSDPELAEYADSDYFQVLEEMGAVGLALVLSFGAYVGLCYARAVRRGRPRLNVIAYGLGFGLLAVMVQSMTDFGQHLPAIGCISAVFCGMLLNLSRSPRRREDTAAEASGNTVGVKGGLESQLRKWGRLAVPAGFATAMIWAVAGASASRSSRAAADRAQSIADRLEGADWKGTDADFKQLFAEAGAAVAANPSDVNPRYALACYRWHAASRNSDDPLNAQTPSAAPRDKTSVVADVSQVIEELNAAREVCPTFGPSYAVAGQIERLVLNQPVGSEHVRTAFELAPAHPEVCLAAAQLDAMEGKFDESLRKARRCLSLDSSFLSQVTEFYLHDMSRPDLAVAAAGNDAQMLFHVYDDLRGNEDEAGRPGVKNAMAAARETLKNICDRPDAPPWTLVSLGALLREEKDYPRALSCYQRALNKDYSQTDWRMSMAQLLAEAGRNDEAIHQAEICLHLQPEMQSARQLIDDLNARPTPSEAPGSASLDSGTAN